MMHSNMKYRSLSVLYSSLRHCVSVQMRKTNVYQNKNVIVSFMCKSFHNLNQMKQKSVANPLRHVKPRSARETLQYFVDMKQIKVKGGNGGDGAISLLQLWVNDRAGPDGGDGGNGGHVILKVSAGVKDLSSVKSVTEASNGQNGASKNCYGKNADHHIIEVPVGTIVRDVNGTILADLDEIDMMYIAARGGAGGHGNTFFKSDIKQTPKIAEYGGQGEIRQYVLEIRSMAHVGLIGLPNAGKSTLLRAISRARPKVANYPFTTLKPHIGMIHYDDYEQIAVADLPGLIPNSHKNQGLGITFLKHAERCAALLFIIDVTQENPWTHLDILEFEISQFNDKLNNRPKIIIANKIDLPEAKDNLELLKKNTDFQIIPISAKMGINISTLLKEIRILYDNSLKTKTKTDIDI
ncbi:PREDICTED: mitochondrial ribosome-associated GTPase 2 [Ceratosolen solmsi marchali]|uniref:Mitochondrial ribosome-associated GTPase 2 n=1 Tax=Ceratosolen solmsi marchali TaxID=326594 RepID=A0AAJ7E1G8_9HYME|nr:PREDICTED: mitochondrial ribosome-associated GTPase 2 [Ceratosolen solmsi marchali]